MIPSYVWAVALLAYGVHRLPTNRAMGWAYVGLGTAFALLEIFNIRRDPPEPPRVSRKRRKGRR